MYIVIKMFDDLQDTQVVAGIRSYHRYRPGDEYPRPGYKPTSARVQALLTGNNALRMPLIAICESVEEPVAETQPKAQKRRSTQTKADKPAKKPARRKAAGTAKSRTTRKASGKA